MCLAEFSVYSNLKPCCYCGCISFEAEIQPDKVRVCHCTDCQTLSGSAFRTNVPVVQGTFVLKKARENFVCTRSAPPCRIYFATRWIRAFELQL
jgi:hypothetical protein